MRWPHCSSLRTSMRTHACLVHACVRKCVRARTHRHKYAQVDTPCDECCVPGMPSRSATVQKRHVRAHTPACMHACMRVGPREERHITHACTEACIEAVRTHAHTNAHRGPRERQQRPVLYFLMEEAAGTPIKRISKHMCKRMSMHMLSTY